ncbi:MAG TPA: hypothetical protein VHP83_11705 [Aggregatilineaceae bacterium]|nr:hypothetical protein [Aggregatilineaceae bacterium]
MKRSIKLLVIVALFALTASAASAATHVYSGSFNGTSNTEDTYTEANINVGDAFAVSCTESGEGHTHLTITSPGGAEVYNWCCEDVEDFTATEAGTYTFRVWQWEPSEGETVSYSLSVSRPNEEVAESIPGCDMKMAITSTSVVGRFVSDTQLYWGPDLSKGTNIVMTAGKTAWVLGTDKSGEFYKLAYECSYVYVPVGTMGPNGDNVWNNTPLPH